ncbi:hypothetical protein GMDG_02954 [Pseudogymnoascus destructans 20631-21]|uniref:CCHC-type domain-containing protein n=1 Tax=Pseudogymnoascus destructans (strain ATCC MYA-4855 / 20631-21) TaxID=658429 RepID=L8G4V4_PSED2|nr:hypothetical protein GMDG_02954 [Pseudogymnoascus destructans 20631-21]
MEHFDPDRLVVNEDHYLTDVSRRALIWGTTTGLAKTYLEPQYLSATHGFRSAEEIMDLLVTESEWFRYMWNKLTPQFRSRIAIIKNQWNGDYQTMVRELTAFNQEFCRNNELNPLPALARTSTHTTDTAKASASKPTEPHPLFPGSSGNCFKCGKPGHFQNKCPLNATIKEMDHNDPEAEEQWEEAVELQSDVSLEENDEA